mmetsp:Transcript_98009/g.277196  ORF Transcript_98009/g.277196 Transcript_98009/m.277196 type:complete len:149 (+) Transcript_98009:777-1223(+)
MGLGAQIAANALSGLNAAMVERALRDRDPISFNMELAFCGVVAAFVVRIPGSGHVGDCRRPREAPSQGWTLSTLGAPISLAVNGIMTAFVIKGGGGIAKAFASVGAIIFTSVLRSWVERRPLSGLQTFVAVPLALIGVVVYSRYPPAR